MTGKNYLFGLTEGMCISFNEKGEILKRQRIATVVGLRAPTKK
jgi:hypothetical protein